MREYLCIIGENVKQFSLSGNWYGGVIKNIEMYLLCDLIILFYI